VLYAVIFRVNFDWMTIESSIEINFFINRKPFCLWAIDEVVFTFSKIGGEKDALPYTYLEQWVFFSLRLNYKKILNP